MVQMFHFFTVQGLIQFCLFCSTLFVYPLQKRKNDRDAVFLSIELFIRFEINLFVKDFLSSLMSGNYNFH